MGLLGSLLGGSSRRRYGYGRRRSAGYFGGVRGRQSTGFLANPLARVALGTLGALGASRLYAGRRRAAATGAPPRY
jgi:hypothetical protein